jgi:phosphoribosyl-AMP cyclohydrolase
MKRAYFEAIESLGKHCRLDFDEVLSELAFNEDGLIPVISQDADTKTVLMFAWMNRAALEMTLDSKKMTYWSRSREQFWVKGESSGNTQELVSMAFDCDGDAILCLVKQRGGACHTGRRDCFYLEVDSDSRTVTLSSDPNM